MRPLARLAGQVGRPRRIYCMTCRRLLRPHDLASASRTFHSTKIITAGEPNSAKRKGDEQAVLDEPVFIASGTVEEPQSSGMAPDGRTGSLRKSTRPDSTDTPAASLDPADSPSRVLDTPPASSTVSEDSFPPDPRPSHPSSATSGTPEPPNTTTVPPPPRTSIPSEWRKTLENHFRRLTRESEKKLTEVGLKINEVTGYDEVERLKGVVADNELRLTESRSAARSAKDAYDTAVQARSNAQHDVNILLERKHSWTDTDVSAFTNLVRQDHSSSNSVTTTSVALRDAETKVDTAFSDLTKSILQRYHEEQVWSDKIRNVSTWVNLAGLIINLVVFVGAIAIVEPWKRRRLVERVEERMGEMMARVEGEVKEVARLVAPQVVVDEPPLVEVLVDNPDSSQASATLATLVPWLDPLFRSPAWQRTAHVVAEPSLERDLGLVGGICVTLGIALGAIITNITR